MTAQANLQKALMLSVGTLLVMNSLQDLAQWERRQYSLIVMKCILQLVAGLYLFYFFFRFMKDQ
jgi:hypothetical protein